MKKCCVCEELKPLSDFYSCKDSKDGYRYVCKRCDAIRKFYRSNKTSRTHRLQIGQLRFLKAKGGSMAKSNLWLLCRSCNSSKGSKDLHEFLDERGLNLNSECMIPVYRATH